MALPCNFADDIYDGWQSVMRMWDTLQSIPNIAQRTKPGAYTFLDQMLVGDVPGRTGTRVVPGRSVSPRWRSIWFSLFPPHARPMGGALYVWWASTKSGEIPTRNILLVPLFFVSRHGGGAGADA